MTSLDRSTRRKPLTWLIALALAAPFAAAAADAPRPETIRAESAQALNRTWRIADDASVEVSNVRGSIVVSAGGAGQATLSGELGAGSKLVVEGDAQHLELRVESLGGSGWFGNHGPPSDSDLRLTLPAGAALQLETVSADSRVSGIDGKSLKIECVSGKATIESGSPQVEVDCVSGNVDYRGTRADPGSHAHLQTVSGDIAASGVSGRLKLETVSGRAHASGSQLQEFEAGSVSGDVEFDAALAAHGRFKAETMSGNIRAKLQPGLSAHVEAETFSGDIRSDFGKVKRPE